MKNALLACLGLCLADAAPAKLAAQMPTSSRLQGVSVGASLDRFIYEGTGATAFTYRRSDLRPGRLSSEFSVSFFPQLLVAQALLFAPDFGAAYHVSMPQSTLLIKAGGSALTGVGTEVVFIPGAHLGAGLILRIDGQTGIRVDATRHFYTDAGETEAIWSIGIGLASLRPQRR
jgi:hypothetical protein